MALIVVLIVLVAVAMFLVKSVRIANEYERGVVFRLGRLLGVKGPGLFLLIPFIDRALRVDLRTVTLNVPPQEIITRDNVTVTVNAVVYFRVVEPRRAIVQVENYVVATSQIAQTTLRSVTGEADLDQLLSQRDDINQRLEALISQQTLNWGVEVHLVELKDVELPTSMQRAIARQAEAERERRAKIIAAEGEAQASQMLSQAASVITAQPGALQLRYLQTISEVGTSEGAKTMVIPLPVEMLEFFGALGGSSRAPAGNGNGNGGPPATRE
ncbi:MAG: slipin family protein [Thermoleophilia bacterium]